MTWEQYVKVTKNIGTANKERQSVKQATASIAIVYRNLLKKKVSPWGLNMMPRHNGLLPSAVTGRISICFRESRTRRWN